MWPAKPDVADWVVLVRSEYLESPGMSLTIAQARQFWCMNPTTCDAVFAALVADGFLHCTKEGRFVRSEIER